MTSCEDALANASNPFDGKILISFSRSRCLVLWNRDPVKENCGLKSGETL